MSKKVTTTSAKYKDLITKSETQVQAELVDLTVEQAANTLEQGTLAVKSQLISAESEVKKAQVAVSTAERELDKTKSASPLNVQNILDARTDVQQATLNVQSKQESYEQLKSAYQFLVDLKSELF